MIYIRTDANKYIGAGHVMRCIAIAGALRNLGEDSIFITAEPDAATIIQESGFKYILINGIWNDLDYEINYLTDLIRNNNIEKILIDSYYVTNKYFQSLPKETQIIYLGSLAKAFNNIKLLINYSSIFDDTFYEENYREKGTCTLLGVKYAPLRKEFQKLSLIKSNFVKSILITTGSTDKNNVTLKIINYLLSDSIFRKLQINVIIGALNNHYDEIYKLKSCFENVILHSNVHNMAEIIRENQLAVSASGTTLYELCACGIPTVSFSLVKEQEKDGLKFASDGIIPYAGSFEDINNTDIVLYRIREMLTSYIMDADMRSEKSMLMNEYIDGNGSTRIANAILNLQ